MGNHRQQPAAAAAHPPSPSPTAKMTSKYTNKDGSKFITIPKANSSTTDSAQPSPSLDPSDGKTPAVQSDHAGPDSPAPTINRKKQKRREKAAAKAAAEQALNKQAPPSPTDSAAPSHDRRSLDVEHDFSDAEDEHDHQSARENGTATPAKSKKSKKKKKKAAGAGADDTHSYEDYHDHHNHPDHVHHQRGHNHPPQATQRGPGISKEKIWNTSSQEERQRIKDFWLGLGEDERKSLVKVEKDAVLKKMKEQQKHTCSCTVCGRKRTAIEEELEGLYDAYYEELEQYAHTGNPNGEGPPMMGSPKHLGPVGNRVDSSRGPPSNYPHQPSHGRIVEHVSDDEEDEEDDYDSQEELDEDDGYDEDEPPEVNNRNDYAHDFLAFGQSLTVQGGILTVADDLLKNDGRKFIEMMEQLAERRMAREEEAKDAYTRNYGHPNGGYGHSHPPPEEEEYEEDEEEYEEDDEEDYDSQEEEDAMTEEQRMEEGRRMFQIFAARMFEQRVLSAYKAKVAEERQQKLIEELDVEKRNEEQRKAKKAKEAQKRKEKAAKKKEALAEEKARKEAEKAAEEAARKAEEERKAAEQRQKAEEKRKRREEQRKAEEQERLRKEAERQRQKEKQAEQERKAREAKEKEKKAREEAARQKEKEARERKEQESRERKEQQEREKKEREAKSKADREAREKLAQAQQKVTQSMPKQAEPVVQRPTPTPPTATPITLVKRPAQHAMPTAVPALPQQPASATTAGVASPQIAIATPAIPRAPLSMRNRQPSQQESTSGSSQSTSQSESNPSQAPSPHVLTPSHTSPAPVGLTSKMAAQQPSQTASPMNVPSKAAVPPHFGGFGFGHVPPGIPPLPPPGFASPMHQNSAFPASPFSPFASPAMGGLPASLNRPPPGRSFGHPPPPPGFNGAHETPFPGMGQGFQPGPPRDTLPMSHQRQGSIGHDHPSPSVSTAQPVGKPMPIGRPPSVAPGQRPAASLPNAGWGGAVPESQGLGSSALLADSEEAPQDFPTAARRNTSALPLGMSFSNSSNMDPGGMFNSLWTPAGQQSFFGSPPPPGLPAQSAPWPTAGQASSAFGLQNGIGRHNRSVTVRQLLCHACREVAESPATAAEDRLDTGHVSLRAVKNRIDQHQRATQQEPTTDGELVDICETLGNAANGGGNFDVLTVSGRKYVRWVPDRSGADGHPLQRAPIGAPGQIGSPAIGYRSSLSTGLNN